MIFYPGGNKGQKVQQDDVPSAIREGERVRKAEGWSAQVEIFALIFWTQLRRSWRFSTTLFEMR